MCSHISKLYLARITAAVAPGVKLHHWEIVSSVTAMNYITSGHELHHLSGATPTSSILLACHLGKRVQFHRSGPIWSMFTTLGVQEGAFRPYTQQTCLTTVPSFHPVQGRCDLPQEGASFLWRNSLPHTYMIVTFTSSPTPTQLH